MPRALAAYQRGDWTEAERVCRAVLAVKADYFDALHLLGVVAGRTRRAPEAVELLSSAVSVNPNNAEAYNHLGVALGKLRRHAEALASYDRAIALKPDYADAHCNRGVALSDLRRHTEALASYERAIALKPDYAEAYNNSGVALSDLRRHTEALASYERAIALKPDYASAHRNLAHVHLLLGDFIAGWRGNEWRWKTEGFAGQRRDFARPLWLGGESLTGKTILLHSEQGLGDTLQFCRYAKVVAGLGAKVVLEVPPPLLPLLAGLEGVTQVLPKGAPLPDFDYHCPLLSLPLAFRTDLHNVPDSVPYVRGDATRLAAWRDKLGARTKPRVGLAWSGSMALRHDRRSMALAEMLPLVCDWAECLSLQKEVRDIDAALLASRADLRHFGGELKDFADTAAIVELMDVVVTVDTSVAHLTGAMGKVAVDTASVQSGLALAVGQGGQPLVSDRAPVSATRIR